MAGLTVNIFSGEIGLFIFRAEWKLEGEVVGVDFEAEVTELRLEPGIGQGGVVLLRLKAEVFQQAEKINARFNSLGLK